MFVQVHALSLGDKNAEKVKNNNVLVPTKNAPDRSVSRNMPSHRSKSKTRSKRSSDDNDAPEVTTTTGVVNRKRLDDVDYEIYIKRTNVERCVQHCNSVGVAVEDLERTVLNFFCERRLPPECFDRNNDDETKISKVIDRLTAAYFQEPKFPVDSDLLSRELDYELSKDEIYFVCFHESFTARLDVEAEDEHGNIVDSSSNEANNSNDIVQDVRVLKLRFPKYSYCAGFWYYYGYNYQTFTGPPANRNETIEFNFHLNGNKMVNEVDKCIRNLCKPFKSKRGGLMKRMDKCKAFYLMNSEGEIVLLNAELLSRCPKKGSKTKFTSDDYLYVCTHESKGDEATRRPLPVYLRTYKFATPIPQIIKLIWLLILLWLSNLPLSLESFQYLGYGPIISESVCCITFGYSLRSQALYW